jgi:hypothetical protein
MNVHTQPSQPAPRVGQSLASCHAVVDSIGVSYLEVS